MGAGPTPAGSRVRSGWAWRAAPAATCRRERRRPPPRCRSRHPPPAASCRSSSRPRRCETQEPGRACGGAHACCWRQFGMPVPVLPCCMPPRPLGMPCSSGLAAQLRSKSSACVAHSSSCLALLVPSPFMAAGALAAAGVPDGAAALPQLPRVPAQPGGGVGARARQLRGACSGGAARCFCLRCSRLQCTSHVAYAGQQAHGG